MHIKVIENKNTTRLRKSTTKAETEREKPKEAYVGQAETRYDTRGINCIVHGGHTCKRGDRAPRPCVSGIRVEKDREDESKDKKSNEM